MTCIINRLLISGLAIPLMVISLTACNSNPSGKKRQDSSIITDSLKVEAASDDSQPVYSLLVLPKNPVPGESFRILATGGKNIHKAQIIVRGLSGELKSQKSKTGNELPFWRIVILQGVRQATTISPW